MVVKRSFPDIDSLIRRGFVCVDMHVHTHHSLDCSTKVEDIKKLCSKKGFFVAITDHNSINGVLEAKKINMAFVPGIEVTSLEGAHVLFYFSRISDLKKFFDNEIKHCLINPMRTSISNFRLFEISKKYDCIVSAAHPFGSGNCGLYKLKKHFDPVFVEGINASISAEKNSGALNLSDKKFTAGSDAHIIDYVGRSLTCIKSDSLKDFLFNLQNDDFLIIGVEIGFLLKLKVNFFKELSLWKSMKTKDLIKNRLKQVGLMIK
ncbi:PHP domain-containing protein [Candidatus Woesearchaeota archaeon]|nr:PHP domain-containing protein [Candidatus Woesearchaeota archaeon]